ncbi:2-C-methyl-D-erythritol 4-phosphate cytidylyltransferase [Paracandidimonas soli]|uniref:2-C-methyl-D-erythritol 4-phosphate cytidylyltransferase n=1 Tax=Paracandidimonas soli TaxID=1917182 RepID=A0A4R3VAR5_9BURK|nr:2-C-methyl-D-erythritol 4-phosphate cytidylyltransferase [Paracandidimonas soli]TCV00638.1 2-C-methyl-D-erythritol 4-phosphate cytidylyltransferase [Paracandidimonas soli]
MNQKPLIVAIVPAAGIGQRASAGMPKQYCLLRGAPMLRWSVQTLLADARIAQVRVAVAADDTRAAAALDGLERTVWRPCGGPSRAATVMAALRDAVLPEDAWVLVHDAARPGLPAQSLGELIDTCLARRHGAILAQAVPDTVKRADGNGMIARTVPRDGLWLAQTPQMFPAGLLLSALDKAQDDGVEVTDEASAMEHAGHAPLLVQGSKRNFKVTWAEDFEWMEKWL